MTRRSLFSLLGLSWLPGVETTNLLRGMITIPSDGDAAPRDYPPLSPSVPISDLRGLRVDGRSVTPHEFQRALRDMAKSPAFLTVEQMAHDRIRGVA